MSSFGFLGDRTKMRSIEVESKSSEYFYSFNPFTSRYNAASPTTALKMPVG